MKKYVYIIFVASILLSHKSNAQNVVLPTAVDSLIDEADKCFFFKEYQDALALYQNAGEAIVKYAGENNESYAYCLTVMGAIQYRLSNYTEALSFNERAKEITESLFGTDDISYAVLDYNIATCYYGLKNYLDAIDYFTRALSFFEDKDSSTTINCLLYLIQCYNAIGDYYSEIVYYKKLLPLVALERGENDETYASAVYNLGVCYGKVGEFGNELICYQQAASSQEQTIGVETIEFSKTLNNMGVCYASLGFYDKALNCHLKNLELRKNLFEDNSVEYINTLVNIADSYRGLKEYYNAINYSLKVLNINPNQAYCLNNIGVLYNELGDYSESLKYHLLALKIRESMPDTKPIDVAQNLHNIGLCYHQLGDNDNALTYLYRSVEVFEGDNHPGALNTKGLIGAIYYTQENSYGAIDYISSYAYGVEDKVRSILAVISGPQRQNYWDQYGFFFNDKIFYYAKGLSEPGFYSIAYDGALFGKGLLLNTEIEMRKHIMDSGDDEAIKMFNEIQAEKVRLDKLYENPDGGMAMIDSLSADLERRQVELARRSKAFGDYTRNLTVKWEDVRGVLKKDDIAIEFASYTSADTTYYLALTLKNDYDAPHLVELFTDKDISNTNANWYSLPSSTETIWGNLKEELDGVKNVYFSPVGELNNIAIEYLPDTDGKHLISDKRNYYRLSSTRELVKEHGTERLTDAVVFGGISYDITPKSKLKGNESTSQLLAMSADRQYMSLDSLRLERSGWKYLPGTKKEAESIIDALGRMRVSTNLFEGEDGTEESFKALDGAKKQLIHIATHGFYYTERDARRLDDMRFMLTDESLAPKEDKMLTRSGLLFAGAANTLEGKEVPKDVEDGIVTAKDISRMDLRGTDLVVLSACQSGLGDITGDGVYGLQRGFKKAGVQTIVMSLWKVNDEATRIMMTRFYDNMLKGKDKHTAFIEAQNYLRKYNKGKYDEPYYYSAFIILDALEN